ncbi:DNA-binding protein [Pseudactinotalea sp. HY158]|uniref:DNA-binding protein n=1 Tax=Pseudactinotalea sp. HY158 TaxID=2654547 RepID=UPI00129C5AB8|nr:DNA-binding protein [Pseudactinotalea sp. HY158]QGH68679.1 DNA-binding protein [Pseudactinotalea sp. HY158]
MKTLAIRLEDEQHARLTILAKLAGISVTNAIRQAIENTITELANDPEIAGRANDLQAAITREADEQRAAITALLSTAPSKPKGGARKSTS